MSQAMASNGFQNLSDDLIRHLYGFLTGEEGARLQGTDRRFHGTIAMIKMDHFCKHPFLQLLGGRKFFTALPLCNMRELQATYHTYIPKNEVTSTVMRSCDSIGRQMILFKLRDVEGRELADPDEGSTVIAFHQRDVSRPEIIACGGSDSHAVRGVRGWGTHLLDEGYSRFYFETLTSMRLGTHPTTSFDDPQSIALHQTHLQHSIRGEVSLGVEFAFRGRGSVETYSLIADYAGPFEGSISPNALYRTLRKTGLKSKQLEVICDYLPADVIGSYQNAHWAWRECFNRQFIDAFGGMTTALSLPEVNTGEERRNVPHGTDCHALIQMPFVAEETHSITYFTSYQHRCIALRVQRRATGQQYLIFFSQEKVNGDPAHIAVAERALTPHTAAGNFFQNASLDMMTQGIRQLLFRKHPTIEIVEES